MPNINIQISPELDKEIVNSVERSFNISKNDFIKEVLEAVFLSNEIKQNVFNAIKNSYKK